MENDSSTTPLLQAEDARQPVSVGATSASSPPSSKYLFQLGEAGDIAAFDGVEDFWREFKVETCKLWYLAGPAIFTSICRYSLGAVTQLFAGQVDTLTLAAVSVENSVIAGFSFGIMLGMGSALETLCGQAYGAGQVDMLGVYLQRSWLILFVTALILSPLYLFAAPVLRLIGQDSSISSAAGTFALWMLPQLFAYAANFPITKFLQAQSRIMVMAAIAFTAVLLHTFFTWLLVMKLGWGAAGLALVLNSSWWFIVLANLAYTMSGACGRAWSGFSWRAFQSLWGFVRLSLASAIMLCLEVWYFMALILFAGYLPNPEISVDALAICMNILGWAVMAAIGSNAATSVRVSNELGAAHPRRAQFAVAVVVAQSFLVGLSISAVLMITRYQYPSAFTTSEEVKSVVYGLTPLLAVSITVNNVQPVLSGVAIGAGWQAIVAYVNIACYYVFGIPLGLILGYAFNFRIVGIWCGMFIGTIVQTFILFWMIYRTDWNKEASIARDRIKQLGGHTQPKCKDYESPSLK